MPGMRAQTVREVGFIRDMVEEKLLVYVVGNGFSWGTFTFSGGAFPVEAT